MSLLDKNVVRLPKTQILDTDVLYNIIFRMISTEKPRKIERKSEFLRTKKIFFLPKIVNRIL